MGEPRQNFPMGAVEEFKVNTMQYNADQGGFSVGGVVNIVTKTGTNQFHGDAFDYLLNRDLNAADNLNFVQGIPLTPQFTGTSTNLPAYYVAAKDITEVNIGGTQVFAPSFTIPVSHE